MIHDATTSIATDPTAVAPSSSRRRRGRRAALGVAAAAVVAGALAFPTAASADSSGGYVQVGPGLGLQCVGGYASVYADAYGVVTEGTGANFQLRFYGSQVVGSGTQVSWFRATVQPGLPGWRGPGFYEFCARNNGSYATAYLDLYTF